MPIQKVHIFQNFSLGFEDLNNPETGELEGRAMIITEPDSGDVYRFPIDLVHCKIMGQQLMGIGGKKVQPATPAEVAAIAAQEKRNGKGR